MANYKREFLTSRHRHYEEKISDWAFHYRSYTGGQDYQNGFLLNRYVLETDEEYFRKNMKNKGVYLFHPHHLNYYRCKLWLKFGVRPTKNNNVWESL